MPWASDKQRRWGHSASGVKALGAAKVREFDDATKRLASARTDEPEVDLEYVKKRLRALEEKTGEEAGTPQGPVRAIPRIRSGVRQLASRIERARLLGFN